MFFFISGNLNRNNNNSSSHEEESSSTIKLETSTLLDNSFNTGHRNSNSRNSRRSPQHIPEIVVGDFGNNEEEYLNESVNLAATPEIIQSFRNKFYIKLKFSD